jgi:addiction module HigA family antidote
MTMKRKMKPVHPGRILHDEFMVPAGISQYRLAPATGLSQVQIGNIVRAKRGITADLETAFVQAGRPIKETTERLDLRNAA